MSTERMFYLLDVDWTKTLIQMLPLILIVIISWLFSMLGSRIKKKSEDEQAESNAWGEEEFLQVLGIDQDDEDEEYGDQYPQSDYPTGQVSEQHAREYELQQWERRAMERGGPVVTSDPIKPKWWG